MADALVEGWLDRIGYGGATEPTRGVLDALAAAHVGAVPFENLDPWLGRPVSLAPEAVLAKLRAGRGGYCFELNGLALEVLGRLGFAVTPLAARVYAGRPRDVTPPRTHLVVRVDLPDGPRLFDVGVGAQSPTASLAWVEGEVQETPHDRRRLVREGGGWFHQVAQGDGWLDVCALTGEEMPPIDREVANWYTSAHPGSRFRNRVIVARATARGRIHVADRRLRERDRDGALLREEVLGDEAAIRAALAADFGIRVPDGPFPMPPTD